MTATEKIYKLFNEFPYISTDSREIYKDSIFFALKGENFNGNKFAKEALQKGAAFAIIDEEEYYYSEKTILVNNALESLQDLARVHRKKLGILILAITGTNGKTTTKELVSIILSQKFNVSFTHGNLNNHIGVPLTLLKMNSKTEFGVVEMGANHSGEIANLCSIADPDFGLITNIGKAHLEGFGSLEGVKKTKAELYLHLKKNDGTIFLNANNSVLVKLAKDILNKVTYGKNDADFNGEPIQSPPFIHIKAKFPKGVLYLNTNLIGDFNFENIMAAICIGNHFGVDPLKIQNALKEYTPKNNRSQLINKGGLKIIMDAYNANPTSMQASIKSFISGFTGNNFLILGDMLELGKSSSQEHIKILIQIQKYQTTNIFLIGPIFTEVAKNYNFSTFLNVDQFCKYLSENKIKNGNILIKGSRGIQLEKILDFIS
ncbi:MAG: UDP-N-acetylmuramoyl-tripeptide--D-alanyl-D-alanine ligase [Prolixibacteraceae bacterium]|jgi:UDP-N-acetylmuramoyl-tripeptide--D-alanyl-D-alanine ligase|nr:UDP-N-acetylmuramoyl-tripeptide--D-alanyl-D-alanine ligase [Prolixibacteraceae bacterium]MBT6006216.1 UDP-N-acetylmuramoyl-tripeptide--D-alanyl-D-alanine ligase [Prolixibacteraceae bacterium]MBT6763482.1 UDP-N-acetylmuramoyl-tripeptide--D-alanyl-D-alanine ligase [Prolixibacteraceae bacterium]MBT7394041.1 UDP-N-acetylmuramoyl-tripeptide--D-alanyl-D-alanine ligase [Prolixibacteraceae bacterium]